MSSVIEKHTIVHNKVLVPRVDRHYDKGAHLVSGKKYKIILVYDQPTYNNRNYIITGEGLHGDDYNLETRAYLEEKGLITKGAGLLFCGGLDWGDYTIENANKFGCRNSCDPCEEKCPLFQEEKL